MNFFETLAILIICIVCIIPIICNFYKEDLWSYINEKFEQKEDNKNLRKEFEENKKKRRK